MTTKLYVSTDLGEVQAMWKEYSGSTLIVEDSDYTPFDMVQGEHTKDLVGFSPMGCIEFSKDLKQPYINRVGSFLASEGLLAYAQNGEYSQAFVPKTFGHNLQKEVRRKIEKHSNKGGLI